MVHESTSLSEFLKKRGLDLSTPKTPIVDNTEKLEQAAEAWSTHESGIRAVIEERINEVRTELLLDAMPEEVIVLRQSLVELAKVLDQFIICTAEVERRKKAAEEDADVEIQEADTEVELADDGEKSSL